MPATIGIGLNQITLTLAPVPPVLAFGATTIAMPPPPPLAFGTFPASIVTPQAQVVNGPLAMHLSFMHEPPAHIGSPIKVPPSRGAVLCAHSEIGEVWGEASSTRALDFVFQLQLGDYSLISIPLVDGALQLELLDGTVITLPVLP
jgi:hypothetical protein